MQTFVLVHGAFHGGWCWKEVATRLSRRGHTVHTPTMTGLGERSHLLAHMTPTRETFIEDVCQVIRYEELTDVVLVGHSFAGPTISAVADRMPERLRHLVYLDAQVLESGSAPVDNAPPELIANYRRTAIPSPAGPLAPPKEPAAYGITDPAQAEWLAAMLTPMPLSLYEDRLELAHPLGNGVPSTYVVCTNPYHPSTAGSRDLARTIPGWRWVEMDAPHNVMMTHPDDLVGLLESIA